MGVVEVMVMGSTMQERDPRRRIGYLSGTSKAVEKS
jgi:hypothetical protein